MEYCKFSKRKVCLVSIACFPLMRFVFSDIKLFSHIKFVFPDIDCKHLVAFPAQGKKSSVALFAFPSTRSLPAALDTTFRFPRDNIFVFSSLEMVWK